MRQIRISIRLVAAVLLALVGFGGCFAEPSGLHGATGGTGATSSAGAPTEEGGGAGEPQAPLCVARPAVKGAKCRAVSSAEPLRLRLVDDVPQDTLFTTEQLASQFTSLCGACHGASGLGGLSVSRANFATTVDENVLSALTSDVAHCEVDGSGNKRDPNCFDFMPPDGQSNGKPWSERKDKPNDAVTQFAALLKLWVEAGKPEDAFVVPANSAVGFTTPYAVDADFAETFTNLGSCVPDAGMVATELERSCELDTKFASLKRDLESPLPEEQLGMPLTLDQTDLFTLDSAELARHGVVAYVPAYPLWTDDAGKLRYVRVPQGQSIKFNKKTKQFDIPANTRFYKTFLKKILDRDGVERYRKVETRVIVSRPNGESLFGTYQWNEAETQADLVTEALNNTHPFRDRLLTIVTDVAKADAVKAQWEAGKVRNYSKELDYQGLVRRYAIPGSERCIQCHMGGQGGSFVLGFTPLQVYTRPCDAAMLEQKGSCDGGIYEPASGDELTQLDRLVQYGVISELDIKSQLVSLEDAQGSRKFRTPEELLAQGYMLGNCAHCHNPNGYPSVENPVLKPLLNFIPSDEGGIFEFPLERYSPRILRALGKIQLPYITPSLRDIYSKTEGYVEKRVSVDHVNQFIDAPWRSLIYRNVDTPFTYVDDHTIYPHMPLNSPGFDCRAPRIMGEWMVSIPALRKHPDLNENVSSDDTSNPENDPQPYREVKPSDDDYLNALAQTQKRLATFRAGLRDRNYCPETKDIVDVWDILYTDPAFGGRLIPEDGRVKGLPLDGVPDRPHWVVTDLTDPPPPWNPRRADWATKVVNQDFADEEKALENFTDVRRAQEEAKLAGEELAVQLLQNITLSGKLKEYANTKLPFGLWEQHKGCDFSGVKQLKDFAASQRPRWMDGLDNLDPTTPVYETLPGAAVFNMICVNCHGPQADSTGRQASTLQELTGGTGRVANFREGLFGPPGSGGANRKRIFGSDDLAARYLPWMALGGTKTQIPAPILDLVAATPVLGVPRPEAPPVTTANMLETARALCRSVVTRGTDGQILDPAALATPLGRIDFNSGTGFVFANGDAELWEKLCIIGNPPPVHGIVVSANNDQLFNYTLNLFRSSEYPANTAIGNTRGAVEASLSPDNDFPWCVIEPTTAEGKAFLATLKSSDGKALPLCPTSLVSDANRISRDGPEVAAFATHGAINAGLAVFAYLDSFISQGNGRQLAFDECEKLGDSQP